MKNYTTIHQVRENVEYTLKRISVQKETLSLDKIDELLTKCSDEYESIYNEYCNGRTRTNARKLNFLIDRKNVLTYTKLILVAAHLSSTKEIDSNLNVDEISVKILQKVDKIGYRDYLLRRKR